MMGAPTRHRGRPRYPTRSRNAGATGAAPATFNPLTDWTTDPVHGVWASDPSWTPPADGGAVSSWRNGGSVGGDLVQATGSKQPTYRASTAAFNSNPTVQGDGTDDFLAVDTADFAQPVYILMIAAQGRPTTANEALADRYATPGLQSLYTEFGGGFANQWQSGNGVAAAIRGGTSNNSPHLFRMVGNGASSALYVDETLIGTGNFATGGFNGVYLFSATGGAAYFSAGHIAYWAAFNTDPSGQAEWSTFKAWVTSFYGITVA